MNPETVCGYREKEPQEEPLLLVQGVKGTLRNRESGGNLCLLFFPPSSPPAHGQASGVLPIILVSGNSSRVEAGSPAFSLNRGTTV